MPLYAVWYVGRYQRFNLIYVLKCLSYTSCHNYVFSSRESSVLFLKQPLRNLRASLLEINVMMWEGMDSSKAGGKSVRSDAASQQIWNCQLEAFFPKDCLCEGVAGQACSCFSSMCLIHRLFPRATGKQKVSFSLCLSHFMKGKHPSGLVGTI